MNFDLNTPELSEFQHQKEKRSFRDKRLQFYVKRNGTHCGQFQYISFSTFLRETEMKEGKSTLKFTYT